MGGALPPAKIEYMIQSKPFIFELDSGATFSLMPLKMFDAVKQYFLLLEPSNVRLNSYTDYLIEVIDMTQVNVSYKSKSCSLTLIIVGQGNVNLAGCNLLYPFQLMIIFQNDLYPYSVNSLPTSKSPI